jgi:hypothetical protein
MNVLGWRIMYGSPDSLRYSSILAFWESCRSLVSSGFSVELKLKCLKGSRLPHDGVDHVHPQCGFFGVERRTDVEDGGGAGHNLCALLWDVQVRLDDFDVRPLLGQLFST